MAIAFTNAAGSVGNNAAPVANRTSIINGRIALCAIAHATGPLTAVPAGWTLVDAQAFNTDDYLSVYWHLTNSGDPVSWGFTATGPNRWSSITAEFSGVDTVSPIDVSSKQANASSTSVTAPGVDPNYLEDMLVFFGAAANIATWTAPSGFGTNADADFSKPSASLITAGGAFKLLASGAVTGDVVGTISSAAVNAGMLIALKDASATSDTAPGDHPLAATVTLPLVISADLTIPPTVSAQYGVEHGRIYYSRSRRVVGRRSE